MVERSAGTRPVRRRTRAPGLRIMQFRSVTYRHGGGSPRGDTLVAMIAICVTRSGVEVAVLRFFGYEVYDRHGWPRVREAPSETTGYAVYRGELPTDIIARLLDAVLR